MGEAVIRPLQPTRFGRGQACYSLRQIFVPCHFANAFAITIAMLSHVMLFIYLCQCHLIKSN